MKKSVITLFFIAMIVFTSLVFAEINNTNNSTDTNQTTNQTVNDTSCIEQWECTQWSDCIGGEKTRDCTELNNCNSENEKPKTTMNCDENKDNQNRTNQGIGQQLSQQIRERKMELREGNFTGPQGQLLNVRMLSRELREMRVGNSAVRTRLNLTQEIDENNNTKLRVRLNNGRNAEIKVMPNTASEKALERLRLRVCNSDNNCTIELKEVGQGENAEAAYEMQIERHSRILGIFQAKMQAKVQVDAENGEVLKVKKPWWAFIATEPEE